MPQPSPFVPDFSFTDFQASSPSAPQPGYALDAQFSHLQETTDEILENLALIQRDDGKLKDGIITLEALSAELMQQMVDYAVGPAAESAVNAATAAAASAAGAAASANSANDDAMTASAAAATAVTASTTAVSAKDAAEAARDDAEALVVGAGVPVSPTRPDLADAGTAVARYLTEAGREGRFVFDASDLSALVAADTQQGVYVAPTSDPTGASGAWVRDYDGKLFARWFGAKGDSSVAGVGGNDDTAAINGAIALASALGGREIAFVGHHRCTGTINLPSTHNIKLTGPAGPAVGYGLPGPAQLIYTGAGARFIDARSSFALTLSDLSFRYTNAAFAGHLIDFAHAGAAIDTSYALVERCHLYGVDITSAASLINTENAILCSVVDCHIGWGQIGIRGRQPGGYSNAHYFARNTFDNLTVAAMTNAGEGWTVDSNWFEGTNGGSGGMPKAYTDLLPPDGYVTANLNWVNNWHGDGVNVAEAWFTNGTTTLRGANFTGGNFDTQWSGAPGIKLTGGCSGVTVSGVHFDHQLDFGGVNHVGLKVSGNYIGGGYTGLTADSQDVDISANAGFGGLLPTVIRLSKITDFWLGNDGASSPAGALKFGGYGLGGTLLYDAPSDSEANFELNRDAGYWAKIAFRTEGTQQFIFGHGSDGDFYFSRYDNAGGWLGNAIIVSRLGGGVTFEQTPHVGANAILTEATGLKAERGLWYGPNDYKITNLQGIVISGDELIEGGAADSNGRIELIVRNSTSGNPGFIQLSSHDWTKYSYFGGWSANDRFLVSGSHAWEFSTAPYVGTNKIIDASALDTDGTLAANSDTKVATQKAVKTYVNSRTGRNGAKVRKSVTAASQNIVAEAFVTWDAEDWDDAAYHDGTNPDRLTAAVAGAYEVKGQVVLTSMTAGQWALVRIQRYNSAGVLQEQVCGHISSNPGVTSIRLNISGECAMAAGDYVKLSAQVQSDTTVDITTDSWFSIRRI